MIKGLSLYLSIISVFSYLFLGPKLGPCTGEDPNKKLRHMIFEKARVNLFPEDLRRREGTHLVLSGLFWCRKRPWEHSQNSCTPG